MPKQKRGRRVCLGLRARAWWVIRKNKTVTLADLLLSLNDGTDKDPASNLGRYLRLLTQAGVLTRERINDGKLTSNGVYQYRLPKDLGSRAPVARVDGVYDPNAKVLLAYPGGSHDE